MKNILVLMMVLCAVGAGCDLLKQQGRRIVKQAVASSVAAEQDEDIEIAAAVVVAKPKAITAKRDLFKPLVTPRTAAEKNAPSKSASPAAPAAVQKTARSAGLVFVGTAIADKAVAIINSPDQVYVVRTGDMILDAQITQITRERVVLTDAAGQEMILQSFKEEKNENRK